MDRARIVTVVGNPNARSRTLAAATLVAQRLADLVGGAETPVVDLVELGPALLRWNDPDVAVVKEVVLAADGLVVASPTYKACFTGLLKLFLDQFGAGELGGIPTVAVMTGGLPQHALAVDVHLVPVLSEIGASCPVRGLFLAGDEVDAPDEAVDRWFTDRRAPLARALRTPVDGA